MGTNLTTYSDTGLTAGTTYYYRVDAFNAAGNSGYSNVASAIARGPATHLVVSAPAGSTAGSAFSITVTALDAFNNTATGYTRTVHFTSTDGTAVLPADYTFTAADNGTHTFNNGVTLHTAGSQTVTATDTATSSITGNATVTVSPAAASRLLITAPATATAGVPFTITVTALDPYGNTAAGYTGMVHFSSSDHKATLPANYTFTAADNGTHTFTNGVTLSRTGTQTITATDTKNKITGSATVTVSGPAAPPGGGASRPRTSTLNAGITPTRGMQPAQQVALLDRLFSSLGVGQPTFVLARFGHKGLADDSFGDDEGLLA